MKSSRQGTFLFPKIFQRILLRTDFAVEPSQIPLGLRQPYAEQSEDLHGAAGALNAAAAVLNPEQTGSRRPALLSPAVPLRSGQRGPGGVGSKGRSRAPGHLRSCGMEMLRQRWRASSELGKGRQMMNEPGGGKYGENETNASVVTRSVHLKSANGGCRAEGSRDPFVCRIPERRDLKQSLTVIGHFGVLACTACFQLRRHFSGCQCMTVSGLVIEPLQMGN